ncbi:MAG: hypothetical protein KDJ26_08275 [Alphaproteobacteria bacterium]|nr:hypothetical protein [Alphaproteobacteria bacterium]MCB9985512.1 hypothetical protein [Micavibrio sp.]HPQ50657.1 hypothetical protein [Alphaproteobacteria bacterium]
MQNLIPSLMKHFTKAALITSVVGCSTVTPYLDTQCRVGEDTSTNLLVFRSTHSTGRQFSDTCSEGKKLAALARIGQLSNGQLHPASAFLVETRFMELEAEIKAGNNVERNQDIIKYAVLWLGQKGLTRENIQEAIQEKEKTCTPQNGNVFVCK